MKSLVAFPLEDGSTILVEVDEPIAPGGTVRAARPGEVVATAQQSFEEALGKIKPAATTIITKLRDLTDPPDEMIVKFGLKLSAEAGAFIASVGAEANYEVTLTWKRKE